MLRAFGHPVATCCDVLGVVGSNLTIFKLERTTPNMFQHIATWWPNARSLLRLTMLRYVALAGCDRLAGASQYSMQVSNMFTEYFNLCPCRANTSSLKKYIAMETTLNRVLARHGKLQRCQTLRGDVQLTAETMQTHGP